jgi:HEAT repeat protein
MQSIFEKLWRLGPAAFVFKAIVASVVADALLLGFILLRRTYRSMYFARRDARVFDLKQRWDALISGEIPFEDWRTKSFDLEIVESMALDAFEAAGTQEASKLLTFLRSSGLIEKRIFEARRLRGWRRMRALVALGRTRAPEGIRALGEGLRDSKLEIRLAALRGLGRMACPQAGEEILAWVSEAGLTVPALPLQSALIQCSAERPQLLLPHLKHAEGALREVLGRVLGEVATASLGLELLQFAGDELDELRAAAARAMAHTKSGLEFEVLDELAGDAVWFVRLRAIVSLGRLADPCAAPALLRGLRDANRLVRLRAAEGLVELNHQMVSIFVDVVALGDRYGLHAYLAALEKANLRERLEKELQSSGKISVEEKNRLQAVLEAGSHSEASALPETDMATLS